MSHLPEYEGNDLQSRIDTIRQQNQPRERIPTKRRKVEFKFDERSMVTADDLDNPAWANGVWVGDAPEDEDIEQDSPTWLDDKAEELKARQWVRINDPRRPAPPLPTNVADLYRIIDEQLPTAAGKTQLKAFWMQIAEDSRMLDWLEKQVHAESNNDVAVLYEAMNGKPLREAIKERMNLATPDEFERNPEMPFSLRDAGKA